MFSMSEDHVYEGGGRDDSEDELLADEIFEENLSTASAQKVVVDYSKQGLRYPQHSPLRKEADDSNASAASERSSVAIDFVLVAVGMVLTVYGIDSWLSLAASGYAEFPLISPFWFTFAGLLLRIGSVSIIISKVREIRMKENAEKEETEFRNRALKK
jgi:hypothetical protein